MVCQGWFRNAGKECQRKLGRYHRYDRYGGGGTKKVEQFPKDFEMGGVEVKEFQEEGEVIPFFCSEEEEAERSLRKEDPSVMEWQGEHDASLVKKVLFSSCIVHKGVSKVTKKNKNENETKTKTINKIGID